MVRMQRIKTQEQIDRYEERLSACGLTLTVKKHFFEKEVDEVHNYNHNIGGVIVHLVEKSINRRQEKQYRYQKNRYHCLVLSVLPRDEALVPRDCCKEYSFFLHKVERAHIGQEPLEWTYQEEKVQQRIQNRIEKILKKAEKHGAKRACKDSVLDILRYLYSRKYRYKERAAGKDISFWENIHLVALVVLFLLLIGGLWAFSELT